MFLRDLKNCPNSKHPLSIEGIKIGKDEVKILLCSEMADSFLSELSKMFLGENYSKLYL